MTNNTNNTKDTNIQKGTYYLVMGRYNRFYVDRFINGEMNGTVIFGTTKKHALECANALNTAYREGMQDASDFFTQEYKKYEQLKLDISTQSTTEACIADIHGGYQCNGQIVNGICNEEYAHNSTTDYGTHGDYVG